MRMGIIKLRKLRDSHLRKLRGNLRTILLTALKLEQERLIDKMLIYTEQHARRGLTHSQKKRYRDLNMKSGMLNHAERLTPLCCAYGVNCCSFLESGVFNSTDLDLVWVPNRLHWMCLPCYFNIYLKVEKVIPIFED